MLNAHISFKKCGVPCTHTRRHKRQRGARRGLRGPRQGYCRSLGPSDWQGCSTGAQDTSLDPSPFGGAADKRSKRSGRSTAKSRKNSSTSDLVEFFVHLNAAELLLLFELFLLLGLVRAVIFALSAISRKHIRMRTAPGEKGGRVEGCPNEAAKTANAAVLPDACHEVGCLPHFREPFLQHFLLLLFTQLGLHTTHRQSKDRL